MFNKYVESIMVRISNIIYNSQWESTTKKEIVKCLKDILAEYNEVTGKIL